jgi:signal transduction histidine kinase/ligand-binding sensor domain-containing protein
MQYFTMKFIAHRFEVLAFSAAAVIFLIVPAACSQVRILPTQNTVFRRWTADQGLPDNTIQAIAQTADRYLWLGTPGGLARFDGANFRIFDHTNTPELREDDISALANGSDGSLWIGTNGGGIVRLKNGRFSSIDKRLGLSNGFVRSICEIGHGSILVGTDDGAFTYDGASVSRLDATGGFPRITVGAVARANDGSFWIGGSRLVHYVDGVAHDIPLRVGVSQLNIKSIRTLSDQTIAVGAVGGLFLLKTGREIATPSVVPFFIGEDTVRDIEANPDGTFWAVTTKRALLKFIGVRSEQIDLPPHIDNKVALCVFRDSNRDLWIGTQTGLLQMRETEVSTLPIAQARNADSGTVFRDKSGTLWFTYSGIYRYREERLDRVLPSGLPSRVSIHNVFVDNDQRLWIGTDGAGVYLYDGRSLHHLGFEQGLINNFINVIRQANDGSVWIGTEGGITRFTFTNGTVQGTRLMGYASVRDISELPDHDMLIGTDQGLRWLRDGRDVSNVYTQALAHTHAWTLLQTANHDTWIGSGNDGLYLLRSGRIFHWDTNHGLPTNRILKVLEDTQHRLWISTSVGVLTAAESSFDPSEISATRFPLSSFVPNSELNSAQLYGEIQDAGAVDSSGHVWLPGLHGPIRMPTAVRTRNARIQPVIEEIIANGAELSSSSIVQLNPGTTRLSIHFLAVMPYSPSSIRYQYKLEGVDKDWVPTNGLERAEYTNIPSGSHPFLVRVFDVTQPGKTWETSRTIVQLPHLYEKTWFRVVCLLCLIVAAWLVHLWRLHNLRLCYRSALDERARMARELHDTLIQGCTSVFALLEAHTLVDDGAKKGAELLGYAKTQIKETIDHARRAVWNLRGDQTSVELSTRLRELCSQFRADFALPLTFSISGRPYPLPSEHEHEVLMVAREALYNVARHSDARSCFLTLVYGRDGLKVRIADDGRGFDPQQRADENNLHYGVIGMQERMTRIGGRFLLESKPGGGTCVQVEVSRTAVERRSL